MERTGNTIGGEGRRQHNEDDPSRGDKPRMEERLADGEIDEGLDEIEAERAEAEAADDQTSESSEDVTPEADAIQQVAVQQADGTPYGDEDVTDPEGVKPGTERRIEDADPANEGTWEDEGGAETGSGDQPRGEPS